MIGSPCCSILPPVPVQKWFPEGFYIRLYSHEWYASGESLFTWHSKTCSNIFYGCHQQWPRYSWCLVAGRLIQGISSQKVLFGENIKFNTNRLIRYLNKAFPNQSLETTNEFKISTGKKVMVFRHEYQMKVELGKDLLTLQERQYQQFLSFLKMVIHVNWKRNVFLWRGYY